LRFISTPLSSLPLPSLNLYSAVVAVNAGDSVLDAMRMMSQLGVSSVAVVEDETGGLLSAGQRHGHREGEYSCRGTSVGYVLTLLGQVVVPAQSNQILSMPLQQLITQIKVRCSFPALCVPSQTACLFALKMPDGSTDGADKYPGGPCV